MSMTITARARKKLRANRGDTIAEVLISLLVAASGILMLATMISTSHKMVADSRETIQSYIASENLIAQGSSDAAGVLSGEGKAQVKIDSSDSYIPLTGSSDSIDITVQVDTFRGSHPIISYRKK